MAGYKTAIITSLDQVPEGHVRLARLRRKLDTRLWSQWRTIARGLSAAHAEGTIRAAKLVRSLGDLKVGAVFVHEGDALAFIEERYDAPQRGGKAEGSKVVLRVPAPPVEAATDTAALEERVVLLTASIHDLTAAVLDLTAAMRLRAEATLCGDHAEATEPEATL